MERTNEKKLLLYQKRKVNKLKEVLSNFSLEQSLEGLYMIAFLNLDIVLMDFVMV